ncbi:16S rRNA (adenine(1518)-N(6)/adenine(1519)-N(6))-dimethyltransferase RsmA [Waterburya agarophytonicola K14]|uniref:Ribosomal RNA small subunit methyltransferase A n=1 Tax=Waterburya agarophytonicola KI4 TaxID=2874699 RepID=A0A964FDM5_9CYAN|nr:16S rRNA (adenine(1518)-N(6)/adenine(1519)-N(6))-dimethyltransferase RsmA [Waterburya agarophytonicola]MCC0175765.1 16S rRNA (adenine(1518)-N(6)/adenine(1519)-N(6))-dimethyltransferase RsmA [Waterburya agarophytonicola KI4]
MTTSKKISQQSSFRPRKQFGQHWLKDETVLDRIILAAELEKGDRILEIGPGTGALTTRLLSQVSALVAVEIDRDLCKKLVYKYGDRDNFLLVQEDFLKWDLESLLERFSKFQQPNKVVANIPYNITGPILEKLLGKIATPASQQYQCIVLLVQKEVGERLVAVPGTKAFGALSIRVQYLASCELICDVPARAFYPRPKVDSVVIKLRPRAIANPANNPRQLETLIKLGFASRRKMLRNNLKSLIALQDLNQLLEQLNFNPQCRAEDLTLDNWIRLSNNFDCMK